MSSFLTVFLSKGWRSDKEDSEGGGMAAMVVSEEMQGDCGHNVTAHHKNI